MKYATKLSDESRRKLEEFRQAQEEQTQQLIQHYERELVEAEYRQMSERLTRLGENLTLRPLLLCRMAERYNGSMEAMTTFGPHKPEYMGKVRAAWGELEAAYQACQDVMKEIDWYLEDREGQRTKSRQDELREQQAEGGEQK